MGHPYFCAPISSSCPLCDFVHAGGVSRASSKASAAVACCIVTSHVAFRLGCRGSKKWCVKNMELPHCLRFSLNAQGRMTKGAPPDRHCVHQSEEGRNQHLSEAMRCGEAEKCGTCHVISAVHLPHPAWVPLAGGQCYTPDLPTAERLAGPGGSETGGLGGKDSFDLTRFSFSFYLSVVIRSDNIISFWWRCLLGQPLRNPVPLLRGRRVPRSCQA